MSSQCITIFRLVKFPGSGTFPSPYNFGPGVDSYSPRPFAPAFALKRALLTRMTDLLAGRYELRARISKGGMGTVWRAYDRRLRRDVAVKLLHPWIAEDAELRRRFAREARVLAPLEHEHIVRLYDYGEDGETPFLVMELVEGASLAEVARGRVLDLGSRWPSSHARSRPRSRTRTAAGSSTAT